MEEVTDAQTIEQALARVLLDLDSSIYRIDTHELTDVVKMVLFENEIELGSWKISPGAGLFRHASVQEHYTALRRGMDVSIAKSGTVDDIPEDETERHEVFLSISRKFQNKYDLLTGRGIWKKVREIGKGKAKTGPRNYSTDEKIAAVTEWDNRDRDLHPEKLEEYLERKFGIGSGGIPNVAESTFHGWRKLTKEKS